MHVQSKLMLVVACHRQQQITDQESSDCIGKQGHLCMPFISYDPSDKLISTHTRFTQYKVFARPTSGFFRFVQSFSSICVCSLRCTVLKKTNISLHQKLGQLSYLHACLLPANSKLRNHVSATCLPKPRMNCVSEMSRVDHDLGYIVIWDGLGSSSLSGMSVA